MIGRSEGGSLRWAKLGRGLAYGACGLAAILTFQLGACGDSAQPTGGNNAGGAGGNGAPGYGESDCGVCVLDACAAEIEACSSDPGCTAYMECLLECPVDVQGNADRSCDEACVTSDSSETLLAVSDVRICRSSEAGAECDACGVPVLESDGVLDQSCEPRRSELPCRQCFFDECCDTWDACFDGSNPDCDDLVTCIGTCNQYPLEPCTVACFADHTANVPTYLEQHRCALLKCASDQNGEDGGPFCDATGRDECERCLLEDCEISLNELIKTEAGFLGWLCLNDCSHAAGGSTPACVEACFDDHPDAETQLSAYGECISYLCTPKCVPAE